MKAREDRAKEKSRLAANQTFGEKVYHQLVENGANFWANLAISGLFSFWVLHSTKPLPKFIFQGKRPLEFYESVKGWFHASPLVQVLPEAARDRVAKILADCITITFSATFVIIPTTWLGPKIRPAFVGALDRMRYGKDAENDPRIRERHEIIAQQRRPNFLGSVVGRLGTIGAVTATGYAIGAPDNLIKYLGNRFNISLIKDFKGVDFYTGRIGREFGQRMSEHYPEFSERTNAYFRKHGFDWHVAGNFLPGEEPLLGQPYNRALQDWSKWTALDVIYTSVTAITIAPIVKLLRYAPGLTYKPKKAKSEDQPITVASTRESSIEAEVAARREESRNERPRTRVTRAENRSTLAARSAELGVTN